MAKKNKIKKLTDEQYYAYIMGLRDNAALFDYKGDVTVPDVFENGEKPVDEHGNKSK